MNLAVLLTAALMLSPVTVVCDGISEYDDPLRLYAVMPAGAFEGVAVINYGTSYVSLSDYSLYDGEGTVNFGDQLGLSPNESIYLLKSEPAEWFPECRYVVIGSNGTSGRSFALNDSGDDVYLKHGSEIVDTFVYGNGTAKYGGWTGDSVQKMNKRQIAVRTGTDTDTASDWEMIIPGRTDNDTITSYASVIPFTFPESEGIPLMDELYSAENSICISVYLISHPDIAGILLGSLKKGVDVDILVDASPAGGIKDAESDVLSALCSSGADVRMLSTVDGYRRYSYLHSKYAVIDGRSLIITSENWQKSSFISNRGWGAIIRSEECAKQMGDIFRADFQAYDTVPFTVNGTSAASDYPEYTASGKEYVQYGADVTVCVSPDNTFDSMRGLIDSAEYRIYCEQLTVSETWTADGDNPVSWTVNSDAADIRVLLDGTFDEEGTEGNHTAAENFNIRGNVTAKVDDSGTLIHNKGLIADDTVWLGSVNWTDTSFFDNREAAVMISSSEVSDYFSAFFLSDWGEIQSMGDEGSISISFDRSDIKDNRAFIIDAECTSVPDSASYSWDTDCDGITDRFGKRIVLRLSEGEHLIELFVNHGGMIYHKVISVDVGCKDTSFPDIDWKYIPIIAICMIIIVWNMIKKRRDGHGSDKRDAHRRR